MTDSAEAIPNAQRLTPDAQDRIREITARLEAVYGHAQWQPGAHGLDPVEVLVATILSQHTADVNSERAFETLRARYPDWRAVMDAPQEELAETIFVAGMRNQKAKRIQEVLRLIEEREGRLSLDRLAALSDEDACAYLTSLPGIGPKTAAILLCFSMGRPVIPVDTHVFRVAWRLGLIRRQIGEAKAHAALQAIVPRDIVYQFHVALIRHGRAVCKAPRPRCAECVVTDLCAYYREVVAPAQRMTGDG